MVNKIIYHGAQIWIFQVGLMMLNEPAFIALWTGCTAMGVVTAFLNTNLRLKSLLHCIDLAEIKILVVGHQSALLEVNV